MNSNPKGISPPESPKVSVELDEHDQHLLESYKKDAGQDQEDCDSFYRDVEAKRAVKKN